MSDRTTARADAVEIIAHRGYSAAAPENTLAAVRAALEAGADAVEFDLHVTRDGVPVLFHDATLERTTNGAGALCARSFDEIRSLDAGGWFDPIFAGEPVPSFTEALWCIGDRVKRVYPDVKGYRREADLDRLVDLVVEHGMEDRTVFISMDWRALERMREHRDGVRLGYIVEEASRATEALARVTGDPLALLDFKAALLLDDPSLAARARDAQVEMAVWTVDDARQAAALLALGVRGITSNRVRELLDWKAGL